MTIREWHKAVAEAYNDQDLLEYARDCGISTVTLRKILKRFGKKLRHTKTNLFNATNVL
jgi:hypothetical protein